MVKVDVGISAALAVTLALTAIGHCLPQINFRPKIPKVPTALPSVIPSVLPSELPGVQDVVGVIPGTDYIPGFNSEGVEEAEEAAAAFIVSKDPDDIRFLLFPDSSRPDYYEELKYSDPETVKASQYRPDRETKFLVHGFQNNLNSRFPQNAKNAYLRSGRDLNVIVVDWGKLAIPDVPIIAPALYPVVVTNVWKTGVRLGEFISWLAENNQINLNSTHIVGFSLGSHVSGKAAADVKEKFNQIISRVTALDPAGPEFYTGIFARKLTPEDAAYVDAYHTNAGQLGIWQNVGQVDFYMNGGTGPQPGCMGFDSFTAIVGTVTKTISGSCSHGWATEFFSKTAGAGSLRSEDNNLCTCNSITGYKLRSCGCDSRVVVGEYSPPGTTGTHYLDYRFEFDRN